MRTVHSHTISRRQLIAATAGAAVTPSARAGDTIYEGLPLIALNEGRWDGTYRFVRPNGELVEQYDFRIRVSLSSDSATAYRQDSHYRYPDGQTTSLTFEAAYADGRLTWDNGRINGSLWQISDDTIYLHFGFNVRPEITCHEMIQTSADGQQRGRTWLWYRGNVLDRYTLIDEQRVADDAALAWDAEV
jgi:hypothetical protein